MTGCSRIARPLVLALIVLFALLGSAAAVADGERIVVRIDEPFEVDGRVFPAGELSVRVLRDYNPSATLNEIWVGDERLGMLIAKEARSQTTGVGDAAVFARGAQGHLVLIGYTLRDEPSARMFRLPRAETPTATASLTETGRTVLIASR